MADIAQGGDDMHKKMFLCYRSQYLRYYWGGKEKKWQSTTQQSHNDLIRLSIFDRKIFIGNPPNPAA